MSDRHLPVWKDRVHPNVRIRQQRQHSGGASTMNPSQCNCCVWMSWRKKWRGQTLAVARIGKYWAMSRSGGHARKLAMAAKEKATW